MILNKIKISPTLLKIIAIVILLIVAYLSTILFSQNGSLVKEFIENNRDEPKLIIKNKLEIEKNFSYSKKILTEEEKMEIAKNFTR